MILLPRAGVQIEFTGSHVFFRRTGDQATSLSSDLPSTDFSTSDLPADDIQALGATAVDLSHGRSLLVLEEGYAIYLETKSALHRTQVVRNIGMFFSDYSSFLAAIFRGSTLSDMIADMALLLPKVHVIGSGGMKVFDAKKEKLPVFKPRLRLLPWSTQNRAAQMLEEPYQIVPIPWTFPGAPIRFVASFASGRVALGALSDSDEFRWARDVLDSGPIQ